MGKCDVPQKIFWENNARFADLFNVALGKGEIILKPENLSKEESGIPDIVKKDSHKFFVEKYRDTIKKVSDNMTYFLLGIESQSKIHYAMPLRIMLWDALSYQVQIRELERLHKEKKDLNVGAEYLSGIKKEDRLKPICTIVLYYGEEEWDGPRSLYDLIDWQGIPERIKEWFADYPMILVDVYRFPDWEKFQTDLKEVFGFIRKSHDKEELEEFIKANRERFSSMAEDACDLIEEITRTKIIGHFHNKKKEDGQDMCKAIDDMLKEKWEDGIKVGREQERIAQEKKQAEKEKKRAEQERERLEKERACGIEKDKRIRELERENQLLKAKLSA